MRKWTVMIYMAGDNDLDSNGIKDLKEMKRVGSTDDVAIIAQFDRSGQSRHTKRYFIRNFDETDLLRKDVVEDLGETNSGSKAEFVKFIEWGTSEFESEKVLLIIWGHGTGVDDTNIYVTNRRLSNPTPRRRGIFRPTSAPSAARQLAETFKVDSSSDRLLSGFAENTYAIIATDDEAEDFLDNVELKQALNAAGRTIDVLGMDACLMSMAEICYQVRQNVGITVASQMQTEQEGWPYERFLRQLVNDPDMSPEDLASILVTEFVDFYQDHEDVSAALAACRTDRAPNLAEGVDKLAGALIPRLSNDAILNAVIASRRMVWADEIIETVDLKDLCGLLNRKCEDAGIKSACTDIINFIDDNQKIFVEFAKHGDAVRFAHGLGIYFPQSKVNSLYRNLDFVKAPTGGQPSARQWATFIKGFIDETTR